MKALRRAPAWLICAACAAVYLAFSPPSPDLAAASYRSDLFARFGLSLWDNSWYAGHHIPAYSLLAPALGSWIGPQPLAAISMVLASALFGLVVAGRFTPRAERAAAIWFAVGASVALLSCRVPFDLGLAIGLGAIALAQRRRTRLAIPAALICSAASPVAGAFLALAMLAWALSGERRLAAGVLCLAALAPIIALSVVFPEGGTQPFVASAFYPALAGVIAVGLLIPARQRVLRSGVALYALVLVGSYLVPSAVGGNADRLGALTAGPVAALALLGTAVVARRRMRALIVLVPLLTYWQANAPLADFAAAVSDPAVKSSFYAPLLGELRSLGVGYGAAPARIEVVATVDHWEARWVAPHVMIARGWERQLDRGRNGLFYGKERLDAASYRAWLERQGVSLVALGDSPLDYSAKAEAALIEDPAGGSGAYLKEIWSSPHWRLFAVRDPAPLAQPPARMSAASSESFTLAVPAAGSYTAKIRFTPYWRLASGHGCVEEAPGGWARVRAEAPGYYHLVLSFSLSRIHATGARCR